MLRDEHDDVPAYWPALVNAVAATGASDVMIAGGAVRDLWYGHEPKDIDIFCSGIGADELQEMLHANQPSWHEVNSKIANKLYGRLKNYLSGIMTFEVPGVPVPVQVIVWKEPRGVDAFDWGLSMAWYTPETGVQVSDEFAADAYEKRLTYYNKLGTNAVRSSLNHAYRMLRNHDASEWSIVVPAEYLQELN